jgi:transmembrane sensor
MNKELLEKYFKNACTEEELSAVLEWFEKSSCNSQGKVLFSEMWEELTEDDNNIKTDFDLILDKIHHKVNLTRSKELLEKTGQNLTKFRKREHYIKILTRVAAFLLVPVLCFSLYMSYKYQSVKSGQSYVNQAYNEVLSSVDAITKVTLPDGSNVWLNHSSSLKYPAVFQSKERTVELIGEGYFEVAHNPNVPFIVKAGGIEIKALGTVFNVMAYPDEDKIETSLIEGSVKLQCEEADGKVTPLIDMKPTDMAIFQKGNNKIETRTIDDDRNFSWKEGKLVFYAEPMGDVVKKLNRWFNVDIQIKDHELLELTYTATFVHETLPQVLELMALMSPIHYSISDRHEISDGTFERRKVVLTYRNKLKKTKI